MKVEAPADLALWPFWSSGARAAEVTPQPAVSEAASLRAQLVAARALHDEQLLAIAAAASALRNATTACDDRDGPPGAITETLRALLMVESAAGGGFARARDRLLELGEHVDELARGAERGSRAIRQLDCAADLQRSWLPGERSRRVGAVEVAGSCSSAAGCCGDWWACDRLADGRVLVIVVDAMGSGARAALLVAVVKGAHDLAVRYAARDGFTLAGLLTAFNRVVYRAAQGTATVTCSAGLIDAVAGTLTFAGAGHPLPMCARGCAPGRRVRCLPARGAVLGGAPTQRYVESTVALRPGDAMVWCTDGVLECESPHGRRFGARRLCDAIAEAPSLDPGRLCAALRQRLEGFAGGAVGADDMALVVAAIAAGDATSRGPGA